MVMRKPLAECVNGCGLPPCPPSLVLCAICLRGLDDKMHEILRPRPEQADAPKEG